MVDLIAIVVFCGLVALSVRRYKMFGLKPWEGPHDRDTWVPYFILDRLD